MARARLRIVTVRDEDILNNEPPDSKAVLVAPVVSESAKKASARAPKARPSKLGQSKPDPGAAPSPIAKSEAKGPAGKTAKSAGAATDSTTTKVVGATKSASTPKTPAKSMLVMSVMQSNVVTCSVGDALSSVGQAMWDHNVGVVVVVDEQRKPVSVITDRDLAMAAYTQGIALGQIGVGICMSKRLVTCGMTAEPTQVAALMREHRVRRIPVVDAQGQLAGIVGLSDLLKATAAKSSFKSDAVLAALTGVLS